MLWFLLLLTRVFLIVKRFLLLLTRGILRAKRFFLLPGLLLGKRGFKKIVYIPVLLVLFGFQNCKKKINEAEGSGPDREEIKVVIPTSSITKQTVFNTGEDNVSVYRIPALATAKNGTLLLFAEARKESWKDRSPSNIVLKRSTDNGKTWSGIQVLAAGGNDALMDHTCVIDYITGKIFLFYTFLPANDISGINNSAWLVTSEDNGLTWTAPRNVTSEVIAPGCYSNGFAPGTGIQMKGDKYRNRLILPTRQINGTRTRNRIVYSDDHGVTWKIGREALDIGEYQVAESPANVLISNRRGDGKRYKSRSTDGGESWGDVQEDVQLITVTGGCHGSLLAADGMVFYTGPSGAPSSQMNDNRGNLMIYRSAGSGQSWTQKYLLYDKASGYSSLTQLSDGSLAIAFETSDTPSFAITPIRPPGWLRLDVMILSREVVLADHWFAK